MRYAARTESAREGGVEGEQKTVRQFTRDGLSISLFGDKWKEGVEVRIGALEVEVRHLNEKLHGMDTRIRGAGEKADKHFYMLSGMIIAGLLGLAAIMAKGFHWI